MKTIIPQMGILTRFIINGITAFIVSKPKNLGSSVEGCGRCPNSNDTIRKGINIATIQNMGTRLDMVKSLFNWKKKLTNPQMFSQNDLPL
jgi:hypothetical protein